MVLNAGTRLGPYEIITAIGAGGMGEVYKAHDTNLGRDVAIKILPELFAADPERLARFRREAQVLASLNHPNIAHIYGLEVLEGQRGSPFLVLELVDGPTLADRIAQGPIALEDALPIARQIAEALEGAHRHGIVHRDLKPANIKLRSDGSVKVLDFGLAKAVEAPASSASLSNSPTLTSPIGVTGIGVLLGTAPYMSPEQAKGRPADKRSDVWAFGCVAYEMLSGKRAFAGEDVSDTLAAVLRSEPDWNLLPAATPVSIRRMMRRCLTKDPHERLHDIADARLDIRDTPTEAASGLQPLPRPRRLLRWSVGMALGVLSALFLFWMVSGPSSDNASVYRSLILPMQIDGTAGKAVPMANIRRGIALSRDGRRLAFVATGSDGRSHLWIQALDASMPQPLGGTEATTNGTGLTWSPDGRYLALFVDRTLTRVDAAGGPPVALHEGAARMFSPSAWNRDNVILFSGPIPDGGPLCILRINAAGGPVSAVTSVKDGEVSHGHPFFLPDGKRFLFRVNARNDAEGIYVGFLDSPERIRLIGGNVSEPAYASGFLLFVRDNALMAQAFDVDRLALSGEAAPLAVSIRIGGAPSAGGSFSVSENGVLVYQEDTAETSQLVWLDLNGREIAVLSDRAELGYVQMAPDDERVAVSVTDREGNRDLWLYDTKRGNPTRFTSDSADEFSAAWSPDGQTLAFTSGQEGLGLELHEKSTAGTGKEARIVSIAGHQIPTSWSADGRFLIYQTAAPNADLWVLPLADRKPIPFVRTRFNEAYGQFSPDGRWIAYTSNETGRNEVYVAPFQHAGTAARVSSTGGTFPQWRRDGKQMFYIAGDTLMAVAVGNGASRLDVGDPRPLFQTQFRSSPIPYAVAADGQRFLVNRSIGRAQMPIGLIVNWPALLRK